MRTNVQLFRVALIFWDIILIRTLEQRLFLSLIFCRLDLRAVREGQDTAHFNFICLFVGGVLDK